MTARKITFFMLTSLCQLEFINNAVQLITTLKNKSIFNENDHFD